MTIIDENKYEEIKNILQGCNNKDDAIFIMSLYMKKNPETQKLISKFMGTKKFYPSFSFSKFLNIMEKIVEKSNVNENTKMIDELYSDKNSVQYKTLLRVIELNKSNDEKNDNIVTKQQEFLKIVKKNNIEKNCPHCQKIYIGNEHTTYVVCGYNFASLGYDWKGCKNDWCFSCGKKLCKNWDFNKLYLEPNRIHNSYCCKKKSLDNAESNDNYCSCCNKYVNRTV